MHIIETVKGIEALVVAVSGVVGACWALWWWARPIRIQPGYTVNFNGNPDEIRAEVTNASRRTHYIVRCDARSTYPIRTILWSHLRHPFTHPRFYSLIWFSGQNFQMIDEEKPRPIEPNERILLRHKRYPRPLSEFLSSRFLVRGRAFIGT